MPPEGPINDQNEQGCQRVKALIAGHHISNNVVVKKQYRIHVSQKQPILKTNMPNYVESNNENVILVTTTAFKQSGNTDSHSQIHSKPVQDLETSEEDRQRDITIT